MLTTAWAASGRRDWPGVPDPAGVREQGEHTEGLPRNLRDLLLSIGKHVGPGVAEPEDPRPVGSASRPGGNEPETQRWYGHASTEAGPDGRQGSECLHSTDEGGELRSGGAAGGKEGTQSSNRWRETWRGHRAPSPCQRDANG